MSLDELLMTPEDQEEVRALLKHLAKQFEPMLRNEGVDRLEPRLWGLNDVLAKTKTLTGLLDEIEAKFGKDHRARGERFFAAAAAMTLATYLSEVETE